MIHITSSTLDADPAGFNDIKTTFYLGRNINCLSIRSTKVILIRYSSVHLIASKFRAKCDLLLRKHHCTVGPA